MRCIPISLHGDDADSHRRRTFNICTFQSLTVPGAFYDKSVVLFCLDNSVALPETASTLEKWVGWSISELQEGCFSTIDPFGAVFAPAVDKNRTGSIADGFRCILMMHKGDEKYHQKVYRPAKSWVSENCCLHCRATVSAGPLMYTAFGRDAGHRTTLTTTRDFIENIARCQSITCVPGWSMGMIVYDWMHIVDLCIIPECAASALTFGLHQGLFSIIHWAPSYEQSEDRIDGKRFFDLWTWLCRRKTSYSICTVQQSLPHTGGPQLGCT